MGADLTVVEGAKVPTEKPEGLSDAFRVSERKVWHKAKRYENVLRTPYGSKGLVPDGPSI
jgi:hypothetical protein